VPIQEIEAILEKELKASLVGDPENIFD